MKDDADTAGPIIRALNQGLELPHAVAARLHEARQQALGRQRSAEAALALPGGLRFDLSAAWLPRVVLPVLLIAALAFSANQWVETQSQAEQQAARLAEIDAAMVSSDLPLEAYLDRDFYAWLNTPPEQSSF